MKPLHAVLGITAATLLAACQSVPSDAPRAAANHVITVAAGPASIVGRGLIVHVQPDDFKTQPTGNAGARSACAVIQRS